MKTGREGRRGDQKEGEGREGRERKVGRERKGGRERSDTDLGNRL